MKDQAIQYLALDVHQATCVGTVRDQGGGIVMRVTVATEARAILQLVKSAGPRVHVAFEEGTQAQWLHDLLVPLKERAGSRPLLRRARPTLSRGIIAAPTVEARRHFRASRFERRKEAEDGRPPKGAQQNNGRVG